MILSPAMEAEVGLLPAPSAFIVLSGFMGAGKSTVGSRLADALGMTFVDLDAEIARRTGRSIPDLFRSEGEAAFRRHESAALQTVLAGAPAVVAVGGGALLAPENRALARRQGLVVTLAVSPEIAARRVASAPAAVERPNFDADADALAARHAARASAYADADLTIDTDALDVQGVLDALRAALADRGVL